MTLRELVERFSSLTILVAGDPMLDVYHFGQVHRLSPEAPVPVFTEDSVSRRAGGAANVVAQLRALGIGAGTTFGPTEIWSEKHRYLVGHQQLFRVDKDIEAAADWGKHRAVKDYDALVLSDYAKGALASSQLEEKIAQFSEAGIPVVVDPKGPHWNRYRGPTTIMCPNHVEFAQCRQFDYGRNDPCQQFQEIIEKRGANGLRLHAGDQCRDFPATGLHVFDVTGAGDTVTALIAATIAASGTIEQACELANWAAGYVVGEVGTTVCPLEALKERLP